MTTAPFRAEVVGSLLRPPDLRAAVESGDAAAVDAAADRAIPEAVDRQVALGLDVVTDGEFRRAMFLNSFWDAVEGYTTDRDPVEFRGDDGSTVTWHVQRIEERLRKVDSPAAREVEFLKEATDHPFKVTFPAASLFALPFTFKPGVNDHAYRDLEDLVDHAVAIERELLADAVAAGARYVQFDFPAYPYLCDPRWRAAIEDTGWTPERVLELAAEIDRAVVDGLPADVTTALHVCRGNNQSRYLCEGPLDPVAEVLFGTLGYDVLLVEWEDPGRMGDFGALRHLPADGLTVVLGLVSSKRPADDPDDAVVARIEEAARHADLDRLALSTQCGFASTLPGNAVTEDDQWRKLEQVVRVARRVWGE